MITSETAENSLPEQLLHIPDEIVKDIDSFRDRYLGFIVKSLYASYPDVRDDIETELSKAIANRKNDKVQKLIDNAGFPLAPNHPKLESFDPACLNEPDKEQFEQIKKLDFLYSDCPNITLLGPQHFGVEDLAIGLGDAVCRKLHTVYYINFHDLISLLINHGCKTAKNNEYEKLSKIECLIIEDFAGESIHDRDLLSELYTFLNTRISDHRNSFSAAIGKKSIRIKPCVTIITTCRAYEEWYSFFDCDRMRAVNLATIFHGYGSILYVDSTNRPNGQENTPSGNHADEAASSDIIASDNPSY